MDKAYKLDEFLQTMAEGAETPEYQTEKQLLDFTERVCEIMRQQDVSRTELATRLGRSKAWVTKLLRGNENMTVSTMVSVLLALGYHLRLEAQPAEPRSQDWQAYRDLPRFLNTIRIFPVCEDTAGDEQFESYERGHDTERSALVCAA